MAFDDVHARLRDLRKRIEELQEQGKALCDDEILELSRELDELVMKIMTQFDHPSQSAGDNGDAA